jgi:hypothetical protein
MSLLLWVGLALACSGGPEVVEIIERSERWGLLLGAATVGLAAWTTLRARRRGLSLRPVFGLWAMALGHPAWWISARSGDCGRARLEGSVLFLAAAAGVLIWSLLRPAPAAEEPDTRARGR